MEQLNDEILDVQIDGMNFAQIAEQRTAKLCHFENVYKNEYQAIKYAYQMMKTVSVLEVTGDIKAMVANYQKQTDLIDLYYRWFYCAYDYVDVILTTVNRKVTNLITYFDFIRAEKVIDTMKARSLVAYFTTEGGEKISFDVTIVANSREDAPEKRTFHEKFTLKFREYKYGDKYYLVLADVNDEKNIFAVV